VNNVWFDRLVLLIIFLNCVLLALDSPVKPLSDDFGSWAEDIELYTLAHSLSLLLHFDHRLSIEPQ
jgi:hypothetical protein